MRVKYFNETYSNCLFFAIFYKLKYGGKIVMEWKVKKNPPHFYITKDLNDVDWCKIQFKPLNLKFSYTQLYFKGCACILKRKKRKL